MKSLSAAARACGIEPSTLRATTCRLPQHVLDFAAKSRTDDCLTASEVEQRLRLLRIYMASGSSLEDVEQSWNSAHEFVREWGLFGHLISPHTIWSRQRTRRDGGLGIRGAAIRDAEWAVIGPLLPADDRSINAVPMRGTFDDLLTRIVRGKAWSRCATPDRSRQHFATLAATTADVWGDFAAALRSLDLPEERLAEFALIAKEGCALRAKLSVKNASTRIGGASS